MPDLWPDDFRISPEIPPIQILREQAQYLKRKTQERLEGVITTTKDGSRFLHTFYVKVPLLDDYTYMLFSVAHALPFYPVTIYADILGKTVEAASEAEFQAQLKELFMAEETRKVIGALLVQVQDVPA